MSGALVLLCVCFVATLAIRVVFLFALGETKASEAKPLSEQSPLVVEWDVPQSTPEHD